MFQTRETIQFGVIVVKGLDEDLLDISTVKCILIYSFKGFCVRGKFLQISDHLGNVAQLCNFPEVVIC